WRCPECVVFGYDEHLPRERRIIHRAWTEEELAQEAERYRPRPVPRGLEEEMRRREVWVRDRLEELVDEVRRAPAGNRNNTLAAAAYKAGRLLARYPAASSQEAVDRLVDAAVEAGLPRVEARATAERGVTKGLEGR
ncbi:hypothetical protein VSU19_00050, partial [Verrucomicrobiales bacterium BCK34]|nr:hypothetical protein [Verrucomicrobiales bacterium BCK34]